MIEDKLDNVENFLRKYPKWLTSSVAYLAGVLTIVAANTFGPIKHSEEISFQVDDRSAHIVKEERLLTKKYFGIIDGKRMPEGRLWADDGRLVMFDSEGYSVMPPKYHYADRGRN